MYQPPVIGFPAFSCSWGVACNDRAEGGSAVIAGGGGSSKTGVSNQIVVVSVASSVDAPRLLVSRKVETSPEACGCVTMDETGRLVVGAFGARVRVYAVTRASLAALASFQADFNVGRDTGVNSLALRRAEEAGDSSTMLATGGEDGGVRIWRLEISADKLDEICKQSPLTAGQAPSKPAAAAAATEPGPDDARPAKRPKPPSVPAAQDLEADAHMKVNKPVECGRHDASVASVRFHPDRSVSLVVSAAKDGTCRVWDWSLADGARLMAVLAATSGMPPALAGGAAAKVLCRACVVAPTGDAIYSVHSGIRGKAYVTVWSLAGRSDDGDGDSDGVTAGAANGTAAVGKGNGGGNGGGGGSSGSGGRAASAAAGRGWRRVCEPLRAACVSEHPATTMAVRADGARIAVGNVEGVVGVFELPSLRRVKLYRAHDLPVTGMAFAPPPLLRGTGATGAREAASAAVSGGYDLLCCSADYKVSLLTSQGSRAAKAFGLLVAFLMWAVRLFAALLLWGLWLAKHALLLGAVVYAVVVGHALLTASLAADDAAAGASGRTEPPPL